MKCIHLVITIMMIYMFVVGIFSKTFYNAKYLCICKLVYNMINGSAA